MALRLSNVRTRSKEEFRPLHPGRVGVYVCGLTVYDHVHIGHARTAVSFEVLRRWLEHRFPGQVRFVQNVTDVDDKILARAKELGVSPRDHAAKWDRACQEQLARLGVRPPDEAPHVTQNVPAIVRFIEGIVANGFAYATAEGNVYFDVPGYQRHAESAYPGMGYGSLSNRDYREMAAGTRKEVETDKRHPADFALWKSGDASDHPDGNWTSPWGRGRPGWHIECSLMATQALGDQVDLHGGGQDLLFPHHENEVAQSQAKTGKAPFANVWMHSGFLNVEGEKMSKSLNNFITLKQALDDLEAKGLGPDVLRFYYVQTHYRSKIDYSRAGLDDAGKALDRLARTREQLAEAAGKPDGSAPPTHVGEAAHRFTQEFGDAMDDDLHTPNALAALFRFQSLLNGALASGHLAGSSARLALQAFEAAGRSLTLFDKPVASAKTGVPDVVRAAAATLHIVLDGAATDADAMARFIEARSAARTAKDWKRSDAIRDAAKAAGYLIEDTPAGQRWRRA